VVLTSRHHALLAREGWVDIHKIFIACNTAILQSHSHKNANIKKLSRAHILINVIGVNLARAEASETPSSAQPHIQQLKRIDTRSTERRARQEKHTKTLLGAASA
jgi:hypothetical protein